MSRIDIIPSMGMVWPLTAGTGCRQPVSHPLIWVISGSWAALIWGWRAA